ncbi:hypothetical protein R2083_08205 [Nitrosomonas sp. Is35]|uniref:hypothetical protein n=1 Tax=Nitrosomonas sp. Is35 TaxID=3080534 RepID=UPI00294ABD72|nr:hypothetical protein [Nitrosomonas sp. Is35]MDV6347496.1 hypothetical protein [Nitrosomonas sp. Is35]
MQPISENLLKAIAVTAELTQTELSLDAARVMANDLAGYDEQQIMKALEKCRKGLRSKLTVEAVLSRIDDGRPGPEEAWTMIPKHESSSVVWTQEMAEAFGICYKLIEEGDTVQARMAFLEAYKDRVSRAREDGIKVQWSPSLGHDHRSREHVLMEAVEKGRLTAKHVSGLLPYRDGSAASNKLLELVKAEEGVFMKISAPDLRLIDKTEVA